MEGMQERAVVALEVPRHRQWCPRRGQYTGAPPGLGISYDIGAWWGMELPQLQVALVFAGGESEETTLGWGGGGGGGRELRLLRGFN